MTVEAPTEVLSSLTYEEALEMIDRVRRILARGQNWCQGHAAMSQFREYPVEPRDVWAYHWSLDAAWWLAEWAVAGTEPTGPYGIVGPYREAEEEAESAFALEVQGEPEDVDEGPEPDIYDELAAFNDHEDTTWDRIERYLGVVERSICDQLPPGPPLEQAFPEVDTLDFVLRHYSGAHVFRQWATSVYGRGHGHGAELVAEICKVSTLEAPYIASRLLVIAERDGLLKRFLREATPEQRFFDNHYHKGHIYAECDEPTQWAWVAGDGLPTFLEVKQ